MWSTYSFVLALICFEIIASVPYSPTYFENQKLYKTIDGNEGSINQNENNPNYEKIIALPKIENTHQTPLIQQRNQESYLPRSLPAYMSPIPTTRESSQINYAVEKIFPRQKIIKNNFRTPRAIHYLHESPPTGNERQEVSQDLIEIPIDHNQRKNTERINVLPNIAREPLRAPETSSMQTVQEPYLSRFQQDTIQPVIKRREHNRIPTNNNGQYNIPINVEQSNQRENKITNAEHIYKPINNEPFVVSEKRSAQELLTSQRIRDVLSSTKHLKRYLVVHPNGTVEHIDRLEPIAKNHPNYVLVNAGHIDPSAFKTENVKFQSPITASNVQPISTSTNTEPTEPQKHEAVVENREVSVESPSDAVITKPSVSQISTASALQQKSTTEGISVTQAPLTSENVTPSEEYIETTELTTLGVVTKENNPSLPLENKTANSAATNTGNITEGAGSEQKVANTAQEAHASLSKEIIAEQNEPVMQNGHRDVLLKDTEIINVNSSGKPVTWFNTSDTNFWNKLIEDEGSNIIYFFNVNSRPRIEKDTTRTIFPDGSVLEELTESIWYNEDDPVPVVTKTSRIIHPDDL